VSVLAHRAGSGRNVLVVLERLARGDRSGLAAILVLQAALSARLHKTAFQDEALYIYAGHQQIDHVLHGITLFDNYNAYFSGAPWFYPPIAGLLDSVGGLELVRLFSLACILATTLAAAAVARHLFGDGAALPSALVFALAGPVLFLSHFATFDALSLALLAGATLVAVAPHRRCFLPAASIGVLLALAFLAKYVALLFVPSIIALALLHVSGSGWRLRPRLAAIVGIVAGAVVPLAVVAALTSGHFVKGLVFSTLARHVAPSSAAQLLEHAARWQAPALAIATAGAIVALARRRPVGALLLATGLLPVASQTISHELTSLNKHIAFGIFFLAPLGGLAVSTVLEAGRRRSVVGTTFVAVALVTLVFAGVGVSTAKALFGDWSDSSGFVDVLRTQVRPGTGRYLVEESEVPRYYLRDTIDPWQWTGTYFFQYKSRSGRLLTGTDAYRTALRDRYFTLVALRYGPTEALDLQLYAELHDPRLYRLVARVPLGPGLSDWYVWRRV
jgi:4-amino-4-deoxy-L-arabinose transferase-like glycosyltransferase